MLVTAFRLVCCTVYAFFVLVLLMLLLFLVCGPLAGLRLVGEVLSERDLPESLVEWFADKAESVGTWLFYPKES